MKTKGGRGETTDRAGERGQLDAASLLIHRSRAG